MPPVAILAGGLATRLRPITESIPKVLVPVLDEPFAFHLLRLLARKGFKKVFMLIGYKGEDIVARVGNGDQFDLDVRYVSDGPELLGTGGAIAKALPLLGDQFGVLYGDSWLDFDYQASVEKFSKGNVPALMTVYRNNGSWDTSNVEYDGQSILRYSKRNRTENMAYIDYGFSLFHKTVFDKISTNKPTDLADICEQLAENKQLLGHEIKTRFYEVGSFDGLADLEQHLRGK